jgi:hypothetical protein
MIENKRAGMQLSLNFLVMLIIAIVIFILSIAFLTDFFRQATELRTSLDDHSRSQIESLLAGNTRVAIPIDTKTTKPGDPVSYGIGIKNTLPSKYFTIKIHSQGAFIPATDRSISNNLICDDKICKINADFPRYTSGEPAIEYLIGRLGKLEIDINQDDTVVLAINPLSNAPRGHYIFNLLICSSDQENADCNPSSENLYDGSVHKIHLILN